MEQEFIKIIGNMTASMQNISDILLHYFKRCGFGENEHSANTKSGFDLTMHKPFQDSNELKINQGKNLKDWFNLFGNNVDIEDPGTLKTTPNHSMHIRDNNSENKPSSTVPVTPGTINANNAGTAYNANGELDKWVKAINKIDDQKLIKAQIKAAKQAKKIRDSEFNKSQNEIKKMFMDTDTPNKQNDTALKDNAK